MDVVFYTLKSILDGLDISVVKVIPDGRPVAVLQLAHGMCGSKERFLPFMEYMAGMGVACYANDHRATGRASGQKRIWDICTGQERRVSWMI